MKKKPLRALSQICLIVAFFTHAILHAESVLLPGEEGVSLPKNVIKKPASDLLDQKGQPLSPGEAAEMARSGVDLSRLNPTDNKLWQNKQYSISDAQQRPYPQKNGSVQYLYDEATNKWTYMARVKNGNHHYRLSLSRYSHVTLMRAALLRKLGYFVPSPKYYSSLKLRFSSNEQMEAFLTEAQMATQADFESRGWVADKNTAENVLTLRDVVLEPAESSDYFDIHWGFVPTPKTKKGRDIIRLFSQYRSFRSLIVPLTLVDMPESVNRFSPKVGSIYSGNVVLTYLSAKTFSAVTVEDAKWLIQRMASWSNDDWQEIVKQGHFPQDVGQVVYRKLIHRVHNLFELFGLPEPGLQRPDLRFSTPSGVVKDGKVTQEHIAGYPQRFAHGDRPDPFTDADLFRYLQIEAESTAIKQFLEKVNERLVIQGVDDLAQKRAQDIKEKVINHIRTNPREPLYKEVESWGGPVANVHLNASRHLSTGTYYDSHAPVQLVDTFSAGATVGYFRSIDGLKNVVPMFGGNLSYVRSFVHVKPFNVGKIDDGSVGPAELAVKEPRSNIFVPHFLEGLADLLEGEQEEGERHPVDEFFAQLGDGEVITITDTLTPMGYLQSFSPIDGLLGLQPLGFLNNIVARLDVSRVILRQTQILRTPEGIQVFLRRRHTNGFNGQLDVNYYLNLLKVRHTEQGSNIHTKAYILKYDPEQSEFISEGGGQASQESLEERDRLQAALVALLRDNDPELLDAFFKYKRFEIDHELRTTETAIKLLMERITRLNEGHLLRLRYPAHPDYPELKPEDEEVTIYSHRRGELQGRDWFALISDTVDALLEKVGFLSRPQNPNPANVPFGKAEWKLVTVEEDLSENIKKYPRVGLVQRVWGGWKLDRNDFFDLLDEINDEFREIPIGPHRLVEKEAFAHVESVDFYRITANLSIFSDGLDKLKELVLQTDKKHMNRQRRSMNPLKLLFSKLSSGLDGAIEGAAGNDRYGGRYLATDKEMYKDLVRLLGRGDYEKGKRHVNKICDEYRYSRFDENRRMQPTDPQLNAYRFGTYYDCLPHWMWNMIRQKRSYPPYDKLKQVRWMSDTVRLLEAALPLPLLMEYLEPENYIFFLRINGFRTGDEDGDLEYFSNTIGDPAEDFETANGLIELYSRKTGISPAELKRTNGSFR